MSFLASIDHMNVVRLFDTQSGFTYKFKGIPKQAAGASLSVSHGDNGLLIVTGVTAVRMFRQLVVTRNKDIPHEYRQPLQDMVNREGGEAYITILD